MKIIVIPLIATMFFSGCINTQEGVVSNANGSKVRVERISHPGTTEEFRVSSAGWSCTGKVVWPLNGRGNASEVVPLLCTDGSKGTMYVEYSSSFRSFNINQAVSIDYTLSNGSKGHVRI